MPNMDKAPTQTQPTDEALIFGQFDSEPTWLARQNIAADAVNACVETSDFEPGNPDDLSYSA